MGCSETPETASSGCGSKAGRRLATDRRTEDGGRGSKRFRRLSSEHVGGLSRSGLTKPTETRLSRRRWETHRWFAEKAGLLLRLLLLLSLSE